MYSASQRVLSFWPELTTYFFYIAFTAFQIYTIITNRTDALKEFLCLYDGAMVDKTIMQKSCELNWRARKYKGKKKMGNTRTHMLKVTVFWNVKSEHHDIIQMIYCYHIQLLFDVGAALSLPAVSLSILRRWWTNGWTATSEAEKWGCWCSSTSLFSPADAKVRGQEGGQ